MLSPEGVIPPIGFVLERGSRKKTSLARGIKHSGFSAMLAERV